MWASSQIFFYFMSFIPKCHLLATKGKKCRILTFFGHILAILEVFLTELEKMNKMKKLHMTLEDVKKLFYFLTFIPKSHILAKKVDFSPFFTRFGHFEGVPD